MRVLHVITNLDPSGGGPPAVVTALAAAQADHLSVAIGCYAAPDQPEQFRQALARWPAGDRVELVCGPFPRTRTDRLTARSAQTWLTPAVEKADVVHLHGVWDALLKRAGRIAARLGKPYWIAPHGMLDPWSLAQRRLKKKLWLAFGGRRHLQRAAGLHLLNRDEADLIAPLKLNVQHEIIPNGIFLENETTEQDGAVEMTPNPPHPGRHITPALGERDYVLFLGRLHYKKGLDLLADAFGAIAPEFRGVDLVIAGPDEGQRAPFLKRVESLGLIERVHLPGPVYGEAKDALLRHARAFCLPSRQEGFSVAILEALASRTPVVITEACHFPEVAESGAGVVCPLDAEAIAAGLKRVLSDKAAAARMGEAGRRLVEERYTWDRVAEQTLTVYERCR